MVKIIATEDQIRQLKNAAGSIDFVDAMGNRIGVIARSSDIENIQIARQRLASDQERLPWSDVLEHLASLDAS